LIKNNAKVGAQIAKELCKLRRSKVLIIGGSTVDTIVNPSALIPGTSNPGSIKQSYGGVGRNIAECLARLECSPHFISAVGDDSSGTELKKYAMQIGIV
jgi:pseudouridine-5'-phosphate glycosidase/pseudouridine kinase